MRDSKILYGPFVWLSDVKRGIWARDYFFLVREPFSFVSNMPITFSIISIIVIIYIAATSIIIIIILVIPMIMLLLLLLLRLCHHYTTSQYFV